MFQGYTQYEDMFDLYRKAEEKEYFSFVRKISCFKKFIIVFGKNPF